MTPEQQRIAIAEACGIVGSFDNRWIKEYEKEGGDAYGFTGFENGELVFVPDYLSNLNAMHEAVHSRITSLELQQEYFYQLNDTIGLVDPFSPAWIKEFAVFAHSQATAAQRAEAFLKTLGLWEEAL